MELIDTGDRKVNVKCDMYGIMMNRLHYRTFTGPAAQQEAEVFLSTRHLQKRGYIEVVTEIPQITVPALTAAEEVLDENAELTRLAGELIAGLKAKKTKDTPELRRKLFSLQRVLTGRLA
jgi:hypothetical protein